MIHFLRSALGLLIVGMVVTSDAADHVFRAGATAIDISPPTLPVRIAGGFLEGRASQVNDRLHARCIVLDDGKTRIAFAIVDTCMMTRALIDEAKNLAAGPSGIGVDHMMVSATHTHSAPAAMACLGTRLDKDYAAFLPGKIAEGIVAAAKNLNPARIGWASIDDWEHTHNRRWIRRPDKLITDPFGHATVRANMHPGYLSPDVIGPSGPVDPGLSVVSIQTRDGKPLAVLANYSQHYFGSPAVSADYYGLFCRHIAEMLGQPGEGNGPFVCAMSQGTSGDLMWMDYGSPKKNLTIDVYAKAVAEYAVRALKNIEYHDTAPLAMVEKKVELKYRVPDAERLAWARPIAARIKDDLPKDKQEVYAKEALILHERQKTELILQAIRIGDLSIATLPNEVYAITGLKLKAQSPFAAHFNIELANGAEGYIPTPEQHALGGYTTWPARTAGLEVQAEPRIVESLLTALEEVTAKTRRRPRFEESAYENAVAVKSNALAYWRLEEFESDRVRDGSEQHAGGHHEDGVALYLDGPASTAFGGSQINRCAHFAGGRITANLLHLPKDYSLELWLWNGLPADARPVTGYFFSRGVDRDSKCAGDHLGIGGTLGETAAGALFVYNGNERKELLRGKTRLALKQWHHVVMTRSGPRVKVYLDGNVSPEIEGDLESTLPGNGTQVFIGGRCDNFANFEGKLDEVAFYDHALSADEAVSHYHASGMTRPNSGAVNGMDSAPLSPEESLKKIHVPEGYEIELVAAEPLVLDPVAFDWDERGRLWVVEMADYPLGMDGKGRAGGRVRILEDSDGDGRYDKATLYADGLNFPTGILCWRGGCLVTAAPNVLFLQDTKGSGTADVRQKLLMGFQEGNQQLRVNGLRWGLDGWVYCANGGHHVNYGKDISITSTLTGEKVTLGSRDFRFKPDTGELDPLSGPSQFGRNRDAWNHWFGVQNSYPVWHYVLEDHYLRRNPHVPSPNPKNVMTGSNPPVFPLSGEQKRYHSFNQAGHFTSACAAAPYLDTLLFGDGREMHVFTCEPVHDVVQHFIVEDDGASFRAHRAESESQPDFFASEDRWCRPVMTRTGPDGALWIADMYRYMIEHPAWLPENGKNDFLPFYRAGDDKGRIYRIFPKGRRPAAVPRLDALDADELIALLESPNGWLRDRAQLLLQSLGDNKVMPELEKVVTNSKQPLARVHALFILENLGALKNETLITALRDEAAGVRENALRIAEKHGDDTVVQAAVKLAEDPDAKVRLQLALSLGEWKQPTAGEALMRLAIRDQKDPMMRGAVVSSFLPHLSLAATRLQNEPTFMEPLVRTVLAEHEHEITLAISRSILNAASVRKSQTLLALRMLLQLLRTNGVTLEELALQHPDDIAWAAVVGRKKELMQQLIGRPDDKRTLESQALAATVLLSDMTTEARGVEWLGRLLKPDLQQVLPSYAENVALLARSSDPRVPEFLLQDWDGRTPAQREPVLDAMMSREAWAAMLLDRAKAGKISASDFDGQRQARLLKHPSAKVRKLAAEVFVSTANRPRASVLEAFKPALSLKGDAAKGKILFAQACIACHQLDGVGRVLGPDLRSVVGHDPDKLLNSILDPSANIEPGFTAYFCELKSGEQLYGIISGESGGSIDFKLADASTRSLLRSDIVNLQSSKASLMPEGLEAALTPQSLADLISYLKVPK